jgi:hypothetical protein
MQYVKEIELRNKVSITSGQMDKKDSRIKKKEGKHTYVMKN